MDKMNSAGLSSVSVSCGDTDKSLSNNKHYNQILKREELSKQQFAIINQLGVC